MIQSGNSVPIQNPFQFPILLVFPNDFTDGVNCLLSCHTDVPPEFLVMQIWDHFAGVAGSLIRWV
jgi:hypothetical protein